MIHTPWGFFAPRGLGISELVANSMKVDLGVGNHLGPKCYSGELMIVR